MRGQWQVTEGRSGALPDRPLSGRMKLYEHRGLDVISLSPVSQTRNPQGSPRGETVSLFCGYAGSRGLGILFKARQTADAWSSRLRRRIGLSPADLGLEDHDALRRESQHRRFIEVWELSPRRSTNPSSPEALFIQPVVTGVAFGSLLRPFAFQTSGRVSRHTLRQPGDSPHHSTSEDSYFSGFVWLVRPPNEAYPHRSEKTRDKDLKNHDDLDHQRRSLLGVGLGFKITLAVNKLLSGSRVGASVIRAVGLGNDHPVGCFRSQ